MAGSETELRGARVLVTRPAHQSASLCAAITAAGGEVIPFPTLEIAAPQDDTALAQALAAAASADWVIFTSPNAVARGLPRLRTQTPSPTARYATVGAATAKALREAGVGEVLAPTQRFDSEALLELLPAESVVGQTVLLFRGEGGRTLLADTLTARGARVLHAVCYRRVRPAVDPAALAQLLRGALDVVVVTSREGLENLLALVPANGRAILCQKTLIVTSPRQAESARTLGFSGPILAAVNTDDASILAALGAWRAGRNSL